MEIYARTLQPQGPIWDFGSLQVAGQEGWSDLRPLFPGKEFVGLDMREGPGVDRLGDISDLKDVASDSVGAALCLGTIEHVERPFEAVAEMLRVLRPGGTLLLGSEFCFAIHNHPHDYWRFTTDGFRVLMRGFGEVVAETSDGTPLLPERVVALGVKGGGGEPPQGLEEFRRELASWKGTPPPKDWKDHLRPFLPPILLAARRRLLGKPELP